MASSFSSSTQPHVLAVLFSASLLQQHVLPLLPSSSAQQNVLSLLPSSSPQQQATISGWMCVLSILHFLLLIVVVEGVGEMAPSKGRLRGFGKDVEADAVR
jgi:hypothetical protein